MDYLPHVMAGAAALGAGWFSFNRLRRARVIEDTPTSKIRSAHQGYVEIIGAAMNRDGEGPLISRLGQSPCLWYRYRIERYERSGKNSRWRTLEQRSSERPVRINDGTGDCYIFPDRAEVTTHRKRTWHGSQRYPDGGEGGFSLLGRRYRYTEELLCSDDLLYVIGQFETRHPPSNQELDNARMADILNEWKQDYDRLVTRFDRNGDGEIDLQEWALAREEAQRQAARERQKQAPRAAIHTMVYSPDRRQPFIIATSEPESLSRRFRWQALGLLVVSLAATAGFAWLLLNKSAL